MTCTHTLGRLVCDRTDNHDPHADGGHTYTAAWLADRHDQEQEDDR